MRRVVFTVACLVCFLSAASAWAGNQCRTEEQVLRSALRMTEQQARKVTNLQDRVSRIQQQRADALLRNQDKGFRYLTAIYEAERYRAERLDAADHCWWGGSCQGYRNLEISLNRRVRQARQRYASWIQQTITLKARWDSKVRRMEANLSLAIDAFHDAQDRAALAEQAYAACAASCHTCSTPV